MIIDITAPRRQLEALLAAE
jgi:hypothetical protein